MKVRLKGGGGGNVPCNRSLAADVAAGSNALRPKNSSLEMPFCVPNFSRAYFSLSSCAGLPTLPKPPIFFAATGFFAAPTCPKPRRCTPMPSLSISALDRSVEPKPPRAGETGVGETMVDASGAFEAVFAASAASASAS